MIVRKRTIFYFAHISAKKYAPGGCKSVQGCAYFLRMVVRCVSEMACGVRRTPCYGSGLRQVVKDTLSNIAEILRNERLNSEHNNAIIEA